MGEDEKDPQKATTMAAEQLAAFQKATGDVEQFAVLMLDTHGQVITTLAFTSIVATMIASAPPLVRHSLVESILKHIAATQEAEQKALAEKAADEALKAATEVK